MTLAKYRDALPQLNGREFLTDGGLETTLVFHDGFDLPLFAAFPLLESDRGRAALDRYFRKYCEIALRDRKGFILDTPTWRASTGWTNRLGYERQAVRQLHAQAIDTLDALRSEYETAESPFVINGVIGPQGDGYNPDGFLSQNEAEAYHAEQVAWFADLGADMVSALTMTYANEAVGVARAAARAGIPSVISFTLETDGRLPSGQSLAEAIAEVDAETAKAPAYYMINCAHPDHFVDVLRHNGEWKDRIRGLRANASRMSHEELDNAEALDDGNPVELGLQYREIRQLLGNLVVMGGCCGTDHRHVDEISSACGFDRAA